MPAGLQHRMRMQEAAAEENRFEAAADANRRALTPHRLKRGAWGHFSRFATSRLISRRAPAHSTKILLLGIGWPVSLAHRFSITVLLTHLTSKARSRVAATSITTTWPERVKLNGRSDISFPCGCILKRTANLTYFSNFRCSNSI